MQTYEVRITETISVPENCEIRYAPSGAVSGLVLPNGKMLKPWIVFEHYDDPDGDPVGDANFEDLVEMGIDIGLDFERDIELV